jgi:hypothetical protein
MSELKKYHVLVTQQTAETMEVVAHSPEEAEDILWGEGDYEEMDWYVEPELIHEMHILSQIEEVTEAPGDSEEVKSPTPLCQEQKRSNRATDLR